MGRVVEAKATCEAPTPGTPGLCESWGARGRGFRTEGVCSESADRALLLESGGTRFSAGAGVRTIACRPDLGTSPEGGCFPTQRVLQHQFLRTPVTPFPSSPT